MGVHFGKRGCAGALALAVVLTGCSANHSQNSVATPRNSADVEAPSADEVNVSYTGGGWRAHSGQAAWTMSMLSSSGFGLNKAMENVRGISSNSGGSWFLTQLAYAKEYEQSLSRPDGLKNYSTKSGYLGQAQRILDADDQACTGTTKAVCKWFSGYWPSIAMVSGAGRSDLSWRKAVNNVVFGPFDMKSTLKGTTMSDSRLGWAKNKSLVFGTGILAEQTVLNERRIYHGLDKGFYNTSPKNPNPVAQRQSTPVSIVSPGKGDSDESGFLAGPMNFAYGSNASSPSTTPKSANWGESLTSNKLSVIDAATMSSAAAAAAASMTAVKELGVVPGYLPLTYPEISYLGSDLAPGYYLDNLQYIGNVVSPDDEATAFAKRPLARFTDGGYIDNTSTANMLRNLTDNNKLDNFDIVVFVNTDGEADMDGYGMSQDVARLFGADKDANGHVPNCFGGACIDTISPQVFRQAGIKGNAPDWTFNEKGIDLRYGKYDVETVANTSFGIPAGKKGTLHVFQAADPQSKTAPSSEADFKRYKVFMDTIFKGVTRGGGWNYMQEALKIDEP